MELSTSSSVFLIVAYSMQTPGNKYQKKLSEKKGMRVLQLFNFDLDKFANSIRIDHRKNSIIILQPENEADGPDFFGANQIFQDCDD